MDATDLASTVPGTDSSQRRVFAAVVAASTLLGVVHHVDHVVRGNHVGWPLTGEVNAFTVSLAVYPLLAAGLYLTAADRAGTRYWAWFFTGTAAVLAFVHVGPWALEPPGDVIGPHGNRAVGYSAFAVVVALVASVAAGAVYAVAQWYRGEP